MAVGGGSDEGSVGTFNVVVIHSKRNLSKLVGGLKNYLTRSSKLSIVLISCGSHLENAFTHSSCPSLCMFLFGFFFYQNHGCFAI